MLRVASIIAVISAVSAAWAEERMKTPLTVPTITEMKNGRAGQNHSPVQSDEGVSQVDIDRAATGGGVAQKQFDKRFN
jgi:hypothetical protein